MATAIISGTSSIQDTQLLSSAGDSSYGVRSANLSIGYTTASTRRSLVRLVTSFIPVGLITGFRWNFYRAFVGASNASGTIQAYRVKQANPWVEGGVDGISENGSVCWNKLAYGGANWAGAAGCDTSGTDYDADASPPSLAVDPYTSGPDVLLTLTLPPAWATAWRDGSQANNGFLLKMAIEGSDLNMIYWRPSNAASNQPYFEIDFDPPRTPGGCTQRPSGAGVEGDVQNEWITALERYGALSWLDTGRRIAAAWQLEDEFDGLAAHHKAEGASDQHACKRALRDLQLEYGLNYVEDAPA